MNKKLNLVSIIMPVYNCEEFIEKAVKSVLNQSYSNIELIAIDDFSTDSSYKILHNIENEKLKVFKNHKNKGMSYTLNKAIDLSQGDFIMRMDADDYIDINKIKKQINYLLENPKVDVVGCNYTRVSFCGTNLHVSNKSLNDTEIKKFISFKKFFLSGPNFDITDGTLFAKARWFRQYKYDEKIFYSQDFELIARSFQNSTFHNLEDSLYFYRQGSGVTANVKAQIISCVVRFKAINNIKGLSLVHIFFCNLSLMIRPLVYIFVYYYYKLAKAK